jgi:hypothetical protein
MAKLAGAITISRPSGGETRYIRIALEDRLSSIEFLEIEIPLEAFAEAVTGLAYTDCVFELRGLDKVGKRREHKHEMVPLPKSYGLTDEEIDAALAPFEVDGWKGSHYDAKNSRNYVHGSGKSRIGFVRYVDQTNQESEGGHNV